MRQAAIGLLIVLVLAACGKPVKPEPATGPVVVAPVPPHPADPAPHKSARNLGVAALSFKSVRTVDPAVVAAIEAELRSVLGQTGLYVLTAENPDLSLSPRLDVLEIKEVGAGNAFTMRDLGLDPGDQFVQGKLALSGHLTGVGKPFTATVSKTIRAGKGTPGVSREDRDRDGRLELHITPAGVAALLRPALEEMVKQLVEHSHPGIASRAKSAVDKEAEAARKKALDAPPEE